MNASWLQYQTKDTKTQRQKFKRTYRPRSSPGCRDCGWCRTSSCSTPSTCRARWCWWGTWGWPRSSSGSPPRARRGRRARARAPRAPWRWACRARWCTPCRRRARPAGGSAPPRRSPPAGRPSPAGCPRVSLPVRGQRDATQNRLWVFNWRRDKMTQNGSFRLFNPVQGNTKWAILFILSIRAIRRWLNDSFWSFCLFS